jgi:hypothetical protein
MMVFSEQDIAEPLLEAEDTPTAFEDRCSERRVYPRRDKPGGSPKPLREN